MPSVALPQAQAPLVLALDLGTSSFRALAFDGSARAIIATEVQIEYEIRTTPDGGAEADAATLFDLMVRCIDGVLAKLGDRASDVAGVGITSFWHSLVGIGNDGDPVTPVLIWADNRSRHQVDALRRELDADAVHQRTGCFIHSSYWPAKLLWLRQTQPDAWSRAGRWCAFAEYALDRLTGDGRCSIAMASGTGLLAVHDNAWDAEMLAMLSIPASLLPELTDRDEPLLPLSSEWAARWPTLAHVPWFPAIGDGAAANVGSSAAIPGRIALTLGTSGAMRMVVRAGTITVPDGLWAYRLDRERYVIGGALSNGGNLLQWLMDLLGVDFAGPDLATAGHIPPDSHGLTVLPFVAGERSPSWNDHADGVIAGLNLATTKADLLRAAMETVAYRFARIGSRLTLLNHERPLVVANGGAILRSPDWLQITADTLNEPVVALPPDDEASAAGAAIVALTGIGHFSEIEDAPDYAIGDRVTVYGPDPDRHERYLAGLARQSRLESLLFPDGGAWDQDRSSR